MSFQSTGFKFPTTLPYSLSSAGYVPSRFVNSPPGTYTAKYQGIILGPNTILHKSELNLHYEVTIEHD
ncbi:hypothetical protein BpHYR1_032570 [Brachionus plicatilis]|uniref:Uncharacterized protein n=1 Tax=Brachionus plicatilis TaxID=10195 RepID=A0A3M7RAF5_BRAPC|nr:hypothetical protein BpHYR1_032570 [Brachionus plicatilis]